MTNEVKFIDTTVRDGNQSLWALNMRVGAMLPAAEYIDQAGYESIEFFLSVMFKKYVREHKENPWYWLREGTKRIKKTRLRDYAAFIRATNSATSLLSAAAWSDSPEAEVTTVCDDVLVSPAACSSRSRLVAIDSL